MGLVLLKRPEVQIGVPISPVTVAGLFVDHDLNDPTCRTKFLQMGPPGFRCFECGWQKLMEDDGV